MRKSEKSADDEIRKAQRALCLSGLGIPSRSIIRASDFIRHSSFVIRHSFAFVLFGLASASLAEEKVTYDDHVMPIFRNNCFKCHNPDKTRGELDLTTYSTVLKGGGSGKAVLPGDPTASKLYKAITHAEEPFMPDKAPKLPDAEIEVIRKWIAGGLLERSSSQALAANKPKLGLTFNATAQAKPEGPAVLPVDWRLEPVQRTERTTAVTALAASPWWPVIAVGGQHQLLLYHTETLDLLGVLPFPEGNPACVRFSRDGRLLVVGGGRGAQFGFVDVYDVASGERRLRVGNEYDTVLAADLNSDQTEVALGGPGKHVKVFSASDSHLLHDLKKHTDWVTAIQYSPDSVLLATGDRNGGLVVWEADSGQELYTLTGHQAAITSVSWRGDSEVLLSASEDGSIHLWEMKEGRQIAKWAAHKDGVLDARFSHDGRIVSCGRDKQLALWDASGNKQRNWQAGAPASAGTLPTDLVLPVRATFSHDGALVLASSWQGDISAWAASDGKPKGEITSNPPSLSERLDLADKERQAREAATTETERRVNAAEEEASKIRAAISAQDKSSPTFQFAAASAQAKAAHRKAADQANIELEKQKAVAAKSAAQLAAAEAEAAKIQTVLDKMEKFSEPYKQLTQQLEAASQKVTTAVAKAGEAAKALADKTTAIAAAAADLTAKITAATQSQDKAQASLAELTKQSELANQALTQARSAAEQDKTRLAQQQARLSQETHDNGQRPASELQTAADKSASLVVTNEAEFAKLKTQAETSQQTLQTAKETLVQLEERRVHAAETAKKETEALQVSLAQATNALAAVKVEQAGLQAKLDKTEKFSDAFKETTRHLELANKKVAEVRVPADHDRKEVSELQAALDKIASSAATADAEAAKVLATMAANDPGYQHYLELEKEQELSNQNLAEVKAADDKARQQLAAAKAVIARLWLAQTNAALYQARDTLADHQQQHEKVLAAATAARDDHAKAVKDLAQAQASLTAQPAKLRVLRVEVQQASKTVSLARAALKQAGLTAAKHPEAETIPSLLTEKQNALRAATNQMHLAQHRLQAAAAQSGELSRQIKSITQSVKSLEGKVQAANTAAAESTRQLAVEKARVDKLAADYARLKSAPDNSRAEAAR